MLTTLDAPASHKRERHRPTVYLLVPNGLCTRLTKSPYLRKQQGSSGTLRRALSRKCETQSNTRTWNLEERMWQAHVENLKYAQPAQRTHR
jgi:hypothetical protein